MLRVCLALIPLAFFVSLAATWLARGVGLRLGALDGPGVAGQVKADRRSVPNTGGVGIFLGFAIPTLAGLALLMGMNNGAAPNDVRDFIPGMVSKARDAWLLLAGLGGLHVLGLVDDRKPLGAGVKFVAMILVATLLCVGTQTRFLTLLDAHVGGPWLSIALTVLWFVVVTNALNFLDNMDGLAGGLGLVAAASFLCIALLREQWFVGMCFALLVGSLAGFLVFNRPPASVFMGDGGSLVLGFVLAFLSIRLTYTSLREGREGTAGSEWHAVLTPLVVLALPLYDFVSVTLLRLAQGKSPLVGDLQHVSHRIHQHGVSKPRTIALLVMCGGVCGALGVLLTRSSTFGAAAIGAGLAAVLAGVAWLEFRTPTR